MGNSQGKPADFDGEGEFTSNPRRTTSPSSYRPANHHMPQAANLNHFRLLRVVGRGAFGKVRIVERKDTGLSFALKYIRKDEGAQYFRPGFAHVVAGSPWCLWAGD